MKKFSAITLVETILYLGLFALIFTAISEFTLSFAEANQKADQKNDIERSMIFIDEVMADAFTASDNVSVDNCIFNQDAGVLALNNSGPIIFYVSGGRLIINRDGVTNYISNLNINVSKFYIEKVFSPAEKVVGARFTITITSRKSPNIYKTYHTYYSINEL